MKNLFQIAGLVYLIFLVLSCRKEEDTIITDADGNVYTSVTIGTQTWLVENLKTTKYNNGDLIGTTTPSTLDISGENTPKYQWAFDGNESNVDIYGRLYTWYTLADNRGICPTGWHVASDSEWTTLIDYIGGSSVAGGKLKEIGTTHWLAPNAEATNETGFTALPGGTRYDFFGYITMTAYFWSSTEYSSENAWRFCIFYDNSNVTRTNYYKVNGHSVRCIQD